jgi:hypothetical protein
MHDRVVPLAFALLVSASLACETPSAAPVSSVLGAALPLAMASTLAAGSVGQDGVPACVTLDVGTCGAYPCAADLDIAAGGACSLPVGDGLTGTINIGGAWSDVDTAILAVDFGIDALKVSEEAGFLVERDAEGGTVTVTWAEQEIAASDDVDSVAQGAIVIEVSVGDPATTEDDIYVVTGARQVVVDETVQQVTVTEVVFDPTACRLNPISGEAAIQEASEEGEASIVLLDFHDECDGNAELETGVDVPFMDNSVAIALVD